MDRNLIAGFAAPAVAVIAIGVSAALASATSVSERAAYGAATMSLTREGAAEHSRAIFARADVDDSGALDVNEYAALATVTAELARLNGFIALEVGDAAAVVALPIEYPTALAGAERARVEAVARAEFYSAAGADGVMSSEEFSNEQASRFAEADRNRNGALVKSELVSFAARTALIIKSDA